jgi:hypothetical protein
LILDGERLSYRALEVEHIGSVYEALMGFEVETNQAVAIALNSKAKGANGSVAVVVNLAQILATKPKDRAKLLKDETGNDFSGKTLTILKEAQTIDDLMVALERKISRHTPYLLPQGSLYLQPTQERRRSGSHYTRRSMTEPIVTHTLAPILRQLGDHPTAEAILNLKICDLAMGSGAFLVEICRQLAEILVKAWEREWGDGERGRLGEGERGSLVSDVIARRNINTNELNNPNINTAEAISNSRNNEIASRGDTVILQKLNAENPSRNDSLSSEDPLIIARRLIAQKCLYGVDKNPFAVNLAKLSLWLITLAKDHPFTFLDHALKCGDSLVGLGKSEIGAFTWLPQKKGKELGVIFDQSLQLDVNLAQEKREAINLIDQDNYEQKKLLNTQAQNALSNSILTGNTIIASFFEGDNNKMRKDKNNELLLIINDWRKGNYSQGDLENLVKQSLAKNSTKIVNPFHWELEFPEVFNRENSGFDAIVGNPPFMGKNTAINSHVEGYLDYLKEIHPESHGNSDLVAHFFRRAFNLLRYNGAFGLIATNTIAQGDTRTTGLRFICENGGVIYHATKRRKWEGAAAVIVSVVHISKNPPLSPLRIPVTP